MEIKDTQNSEAEIDVSQSETKTVEKINREVNRYITTRKYWDKISRKISQGLFVLALVFAGIVYSKNITDFVDSFFMDEVDTLLLEKTADIKKVALSKIVGENLNTLSPGEQSDTAYEQRIANLIHKYNNDFYGNVYNLSLKDERFLHAGFDFTNLNFADICNLKRPFSDDTSQTVKQWLLNKTNSSPVYSAYYNPVFYKLQNEIEEQNKFIEDYFDTPFSAFISDSIHHVLKGNLHKEIMQLYVVDFLIQRPNLLKTQLNQLSVLQDRRQELNLRLGLFQVFLGKEYGVKTPEQMYGWLNGAYKGINEFSPGSKKQKLQQSGIALDQLKSYLDAFKNNSVIFMNIAKMDRNIHLYNPLRMPLFLKVVGLFGARRTTERGRSYKHKGIDLIADEGTPVYPVKEGFIEYVGNIGNGHGNHIRIRHDNQIVSLYSHLKKDRVYERTFERFKQEGPFWVNSVSTIASVGTSGNIPSGDVQYGYSHLHLEIEIKGKIRNPYKMFKEPLVVLHEEKSNKVISSSAQ